MTLEKQAQELLKKAQARIIELVEQNNTLLSEREELIAEGTSVLGELVLVKQAFELVENFAEEPFETYEDMMKTASAYNNTMEKHARAALPAQPRSLAETRRKSSPSLGKVATISEVRDTNVEFKRNPTPADIRYQERMSDLFQQF